jgi:dTDP-4-amino-4,6-dideoxygalactose transaminase
MNEEFLPYNAPDISDAEIDAVADVLRSGWLAPGPRVRAFEEDFARYAGTAHAIALDSATAGMHLALLASSTSSSTPARPPCLPTSAPTTTASTPQRSRAP